MSSRLLADVHDARLSELTVLSVKAWHDRLANVRDALLGEVTVRVIETLDTCLTDTANAERAVWTVRVQRAALLTRARLASAEVTALTNRTV